MPPLKPVTTKKSSVISENENLFAKTMNTRSSRVLPNNPKKENAKAIGPFPKRKAVSPIKGNTLKRSALGNITNALETECVISSGKKPAKKAVSSTVTKPTISAAAKVSVPFTSSTKIGAANVQKPPLSLLQPKPNTSKSMLPPIPKSRLTLPSKPAATAVQPKQQNFSSLRSVAPTTVTDKPNAPSRPVTRQSPAECKKTAAINIPANKCRVIAKPKCTVRSSSGSKIIRRSSGRRSTLESSDGSLYMSALSEVLDEDMTASLDVVVPEPLPDPTINIDEEYAKDPFQCATYAKEIFEYLKSREDYFKISDYMEMQTSLSHLVRAVLIDWMVEIQESFEMNHETLYLGVKLVDSYLSKIKVSRQSLQLVGATAMFISAKYDERIPPAIDDFLYICDGAYKRKDMLKMEVNILRVVNFELGYPLSYRFLRRYARCAKVAMPLLTLARYILEHALMDYKTIFLPDSKMAAAALYISFKMKKELEWDNTLIHFSGYRVKDFIEVAHKLNDSIHQKPIKTLATVRNKYSHKIFYEVAKIPLVDNKDL